MSSRAAAGRKRLNKVTLSKDAAAAAPFADPRAFYRPEPAQQLNSSRELASPKAPQWEQPVQQHISTRSPPILNHSSVEKGGFETSTRSRAPVVNRLDSSETFSMNSPISFSSAQSIMSVSSLQSRYTAASSLSPSQTHLSLSPASSSATFDHQSSDSDSLAPSNTAVSSSSNSTGSRSGTPTSFVFPSSRSRAVPSSSTGPPKFSFKKKKKVKPLDLKVSVPTSPGPPILAVGETTNSGGVSVSFVEPSKPSSSRAFKSPSPSVSNNSKSPVGSSSPTSADFVFPSSRSRAHPDPSKKAPKLSHPDSVSDPSSSARFMGIPLRKKKKKRPVETSHLPETIPFREHNPGQQIPDPLGSPQPARREIPVHDLPTYTKVGMYPLDAYDSVLLESDRQTAELLRRLNASGTPSFFHYGNTPPLTVLDMGCGQGQWMLEAAIAWKGYGTRVTGIDMVDVTKNIRNVAAKHGIADNVNFVKGNFLKKQLPFPNESFDMVRMSCLTFAISFDKWDSILKEVCRILTVGGRLELIDDHLFFAYGKPSLSDDGPKLDVSIPSPRISSLHGSTQDRGKNPEHRYALYEDEMIDNSLSQSTSYNRSSLFYQPDLSTPSTASMIMSAYAEPWAESAQSAKELESLFEHMLNMRYGIHLCPSEFVLDMMQRIFGHAREVETMHLTLASPDCALDELDPSAKSSVSRRPDTSPRASLSEDAMNPLLQSPGLILWPSTFIAMPHAEVEAHSLKHNRVLLSCKSALIEYAGEITDDENFDEEGVMEALWDYENFLKQRFNPPLGALTDSSSSSATDDDDDDRATIGAGRSHSRSQSDNMSVSSVTTESSSAMWEYQFELRHHLAWSPDTAVDPDNSKGTATSTARQENRRPSPPTSILTALPSFQSTRTVSIAPPTYSRSEPTHVRTFHVFEAIKMDESLFGAH
ncbi:hypothetical protein C8J56DRAFT_963357 [Mycena floridula]|nr:hypothetical protein C8J56DRAFT_963357 [Mycena floridula]